MDHDVPEEQYSLEVAGKVVLNFGKYKWKKTQAEAYADKSYCEFVLGKVPRKEGFATFKKYIRERRLAEEAAAKPISKADAGSKARCDSADHRREKRQKTSGGASSAERFPHDGIRVTGADDGIRVTGGEPESEGEKSLRVKAKDSFYVKGVQLKLALETFKKVVEEISMEVCNRAINRRLVAQTSGI